MTSQDILQPDRAVGIAIPAGSPAPPIATRRRGTTGPKHYSFIDALRGVAIITVILSHATLCVTGLPDMLMDVASRCSSGVQLFYALSAYTLCASFRARYGERDVLASYFLRRLFRIVPMFWFAIGLYIFVDMYAPHWGPPHGLDEGGRIVLAAFLLHGFNMFALNAVVPGGWSVAVEAQFYVLLPLLFWYASTLRRTLALVALSFVISIVYMPIMESMLAPRYADALREIVHEFAYYSLPTQLPIFMMGLLAFRMLGPDRAMLARIEAAVPLRPIALCTIVLVMLPIRHSFPGHLGYGLMSLALIYVLATARFAPLDNRVTRFFGRISYSAYLLHFAVLFLLEAYAGAWLGPTPLVRIAVLEGLALSITAALAAVTHDWIEQPGIALGRWVIASYFGPKPETRAALPIR